ncbi:MAG: hypothetical protein ACRDJL_08930 [Actinomycetota bacterium]
MIHTSSRHLSVDEGTPVTCSFGSIPVTLFCNMLALLEDVVGKSEQRSRERA